MSIKAINWAFSLALSAGQKLVLLGLADHANDENNSWPSQHYLSEKCSLSRSAINKNLKLLENLGLIKQIWRYDKKTGKRKSSMYGLCLDILRSDLLRSDKSATKSLSASTTCRKATYTIEPPINHQKPSVGQKSDDVVEIFEEWKNIHNHSKAKFDSKRQTKIKQALKRYKKHELIDAIRGCKLSPLHQGKNDNGMIYDDIELILRDSKHIEMFMGFVHNKNTGKSVDELTKNEIDARMRRLEEASIKNAVSYFEEFKVNE